MKTNAFISHRNFIRKIPLMNALVKNTSMTAGILAATISVAANAAMMDYKWTGTGSGSLNGISFTNAAFEINAKADSVNWKFQFGLNQVVNTSASVTISGVGTYNFTGYTGSWWDAAGYIGFGRSYSDRYFNNLYTMSNTPGIQPWNRASAIGPVSGTGQLVQWIKNSDIGMATSGGTLIFGDKYNMNEATFTATMVPAPGAFALVGLAGAFGSRRRRA
jgi:MYXO-CTERM domain-containing protein